jgi:adenine specific DNA methylase Mod
MVDVLFFFTIVSFNFRFLRYKLVYSESVRFILVNNEPIDRKIPQFNGNCNKWPFDKPTVIFPHISKPL